jgi:cytochrome c oxidase subunit 2
VAGRFVLSIGTALSALLAPGAAVAAEGRPSPGEIGLQDPVTPIADSIHVFHNGILLWTAILVSLLVLVLLAIIVIRFNKRANPVPARFTHNTLVEVLWTALPVIILVVIAIPSFAILTS